ncbi:MAG: reprolysin-like metallopeptidase [Flavobacteriales bacterium]
MKYFLIASFLLSSFYLTAQRYWSDVTQPENMAEARISPAKFRSLEVDWNELNSILETAPSEKEVSAKASNVIISIPMPDGTAQEFSIVRFIMMESELAEKYPSIKTYAGQGVSDPTARLYMDKTEHGFHAMILSRKGSIFIDPVFLGNNIFHISYTKDDFYATNAKTFNEIDVLTPESIEDDKKEVGKERIKSKAELIKDSRLIKSMAASGAQLRTYRLAVATTGEYTTFHGGTVSAGLSAIATSMLRVNGVYETEVAIRMVLVNDNDAIVYTNGSTDPFTNGNGGAMLSQNQSTCDSEIGSANYDIGHVFSTGGGGIASLQSPCFNGSKARGVTGQNSPVGDPFDIDYVSHEMGHQWGGNHTQNNTCNRSSNAAYEPGSASTIMGYAGICSVNLQSNSDAYFHNHSYNEIISYSQNGFGNTCAAITNTGNSIPNVNADNGQDGLTIPASTPFELAATGNDADGDILTYNWEQYDLGPSTGSTAAFNNPTGNQPIFRSWTATESPTRTFPRITDLVNNTTAVGELLPTYTRGLTFRCTVRDNRVGGGGVNDDQMSINVSDVAGPFIVLGPNGGETFVGNSTQTITWDVANTNIAPVNCTNVDLFLSLDGGLTYPLVLALNVPNDGSHPVTIPNNPSSLARVKVKGADNVFFDISNQNFTIIQGTNGPGCTNESACNYDPTATSDNGSCVFPGCTSPSACNYNASAGCDDGSCQEGGCTEEAACNFNPNAECEDNTCVFGAVNDICVNAIPLDLGVNTINNTNTCILEGYSVPSTGCNTTNGWCNQNGIEADVWYSFTTPNGPTEITLETSFDGTGTLTDTQMAVFNGCGGALIAANDDGGADQWMSKLEFSCNALTPNTTYYVLIDGYSGDIGSANLTMTFNGAPCGIPGCTDPNACNFSSNATADDGSCDYSCGGCTNELACNYDENAQFDDESCDFSCYGCTDSSACNYAPEFTIDDGSCVAQTIWYLDSDSDGFGNDDITTLSCEQPLAFVGQGGDCNDLDGEVNPNAEETCGNGEDDNCNGETDENFIQYYLDSDLDGFGDPLFPVEACEISSGITPNDLDCDDSNEDVYPGAPGTAEGIDNDCSGELEEDELIDCAGDFNNDGIVGIGDLAFILADFGCTLDCIADLNNDAQVNAADLSVFLSLFGTSCE